MKILPNQIVAAKSWHGFTDKNHLVNALDLDQIAIADKLVEIGDMNFGEDFVSMIMKHGTYTIPVEKDVLRWRLKNAVEENYELLGAYEDSALTTTVGSSAGYKAKAGTTFYMVFNNKPFSKTEVIVGNKPDAYQIWITEEPTPIGDNKFSYKVQLLGKSNAFIPASELAAGTRWSSEKGLVPDSLSYEGMDISFSTHAMMETRLTQFRIEHQISGRMVKIKPMWFYVENGKGNKEVLWLTNVEYELLRKARITTANIIMNSHSNVNDDGSITNIDKNGYAATSSAGFKEQWSSTNLHRWNLAPDLD